MRAFAFGSTLGVVSSLVLGKRDLTEKNGNYYSSYKIMGMALIGAIIVWCTFPILLLSTTFNSSTGVIVSMSGQVNMWQALSSSVLGGFACSSLYF